MAIGTSIFYTAWQESVYTSAAPDDLSGYDNWLKVRDTVATGARAWFYDVGAGNIEVRGGSAASGGNLAGTTEAEFDNTITLVRTAGTYDNNQYAEVSYRQLAASGVSGYGVGAVVRSNGSTGASARYYFAFLNEASPKHTIIGKWVDGEYTQLVDDTSITWNASGSIGLLVNGTTLTVYKDGSPTTVTTTDTELSSGRPGFFLSSAGTDYTHITAFDGGNYSATSSAPLNTIGYKKIGFNPGF